MANAKLDADQISKFGSEIEIRISNGMQIELQKFLLPIPLEFRFET